MWFIAIYPSVVYELAHNDSLPWVMGLQIFARVSHATHQPIIRPAVTFVSYECITNLHNNLGGWICGLLLFILVWSTNRPAMTVQALYR